MNLRDFRIGWRLLFKEPAYSAVVILGLAVGFAACFLLLGYVRHSFSYDEHVPEREQVFRLMQRWNQTIGSHPTWNDFVSMPARDAAVASGQPLLASGVIQWSIDVRVGAQVQSIGVTYVHPEFQQIFQPRVLAGDLATALTRPDALALTRETAIKLFGRADAVGQTLQAGGKPYLVAAVVEDPPAATTVPFESLSGLGSAQLKPDLRELIMTNWGSGYGRAYIKLLPGANAQAVTDAMQRAFRASPIFQRLAPDQLAALGGRNLLDFKLSPLAIAYLDPDLKDYRRSTNGDRQAIIGLAAVAALILLLAATNYVNLATVRTLRRQKEIAVRKVLGASSAAVTRQFLAESVLVCLIATALGLLLAWLALPVFSDLVQRKLDGMFSPAALAASVLLGIVLGLASGAYPTWSALRVLPGAALAGRGNSETTSGLWLRRVLTVLQFATAMGLTATTLAVAWQTHYATRLDPGFDPDRLLIFDAPNDMRNADVAAFRNALARLPGVEVVSVSDGPVTELHNTTSLRRQGGESIEIPFYQVDPAYFDVYGLKPVAGRLYSPRLDRMSDEDKVVVNVAGARKFGFASPQDAVGKFVESPNGYEATMQIVGVAPDIRHHSAHDEAQPSVYYLDDRIDTFVVRSRHDLEGVERAIEEMWPRFFPNDVLGMQRVSALFRATYADDLRLAKLLGASSVIAIAIAAFGIYVLSAYSVQRRTKEIVLRKLYGAGGGAIGRLVAREFAALIGAGAMLGLPLAWLAIERYLAAFTERAPIGLWPARWRWRQRWRWVRPCAIRWPPCGSRPRSRCATDRSGPRPYAVGWALEPTR